jgi:hypothetical protein
VRPAKRSAVREDRHEDPLPASTTARRAASRSGSSGPCPSCEVRGPSPLLLELADSPEVDELQLPGVHSVPDRLRPVRGTVDPSRARERLALRPGARPPPMTATKRLLPDAAEPAATP